MAPPKKGPAQVIEGSLDRFPFPEVVGQLYREAATGILVIKQGNEEKKACFQEGRIIYASSTNKEEKLGFLLVEEGLIGREELLQAADAGQDLRAFLIESGKMTEDELDDATAGLITDIVASSFLWRRGEFSFVEKDTLAIPGQVDCVAMPDLFVEGTRLLQDNEYVASLFGEDGLSVEPGSTAELLEEPVHLEPTEELVMAGIQGPQPVGEILASSMMGPDMTRRFLYALVLCGHLDAPDRKVQGLPKASSRSKFAKTRRKGVRKGVRKSVIKKKPAAATAPKASSSATASTPAEAGPEAAAIPDEPFDQQIQRLFTETSGKNHYEILGVAQKADDGEIRNRYYALAKAYHPDKLGPDADDQLRTQLEQLFGRFGEAYNVLRDADARKEYDEQLASGEAEEKEVDPKQVARESYEKGLALLKTDAGSAARFFEYAVNTDDSNAEYWYQLGVALSSRPMSRKKAEEALLKCQQLDPSLYRSYFQLGLLYKAGGLKTKAIQMIRQGLQWDNSNLKMQQVLSELEGGGEEKKGGLGGLFKKK